MVCALFRVCDKIVVDINEDGSIKNLFGRFKVKDFRRAKRIENGC